MADIDPPAVPIPQIRPDDPRLGQLFGSDVPTPADAELVIVGFPSDEGVAINGGRPGAAEGPDAIRKQLYKLTPDPRAIEQFTALARRTLDVGNLQLSGRLENNQERLGEALASYFQAGATVIVLGGGHETAFAHFLGYVHDTHPVAILNWDAHADVRPLREGRAHSGSPFRQAIEHESGVLRRYTVAGLQAHSTAAAHTRYLQDQECRILWRSDVTNKRIQAVYQNLNEATMVTFDLDALDQSIAPGVSAPAANGLTAELWLRAAFEAGRSPHVTSIDVSECNPNADVDSQTARMAALTVWHFLSGYCTR